jgi:transposase
LPEELRGQADLLEEQLVLFERQLEGMREQVAERVRGSGLAPYVMSIPGIGIDIAAALPAYLGDGSRFSGSAQVANYAGLTLRVDCSGDDGALREYSEIPVLPSDTGGRKGCGRW